MHSIILIILLSLVNTEERKKRKEKKRKMRKPLLFLLLLSLASSFNEGLAEAKKDVGRKLAGESPFTAKASLIRYWKKHVSNDLPKPWFLLNKASPLNAVQLATFSKLADQKSLSTQLPSFCSKANLLCFPDISGSLEKHRQDVNFATYSDKNFTNYGTNRPGGLDSFKNYSKDENIPFDNFRRYSRGSIGHNDKFSGYALDGNVADESFNTYGTTATGGAAKFSSYENGENVPNLRFTSYSDDANGRNQGFSSYSNDANGGEQDFKSYGKNGNGGENEFTTYSNRSNVIVSSFSNYGKTGNGVKDSFTKYGFDGNVPQNNFSSYGDGGNAAIETFKIYSDQANVGDDSFKSYAKNSNSAKANFVNYGQSFNRGPVQFTSYGEAANGQQIGFKIYGENYDFKKYAKNGVTFKTYLNESSSLEAAADGVKKVNNKWTVEPGKFFRERMLKSGTVMPMPNIRDKMPKRSFLPRVILTKLAFSTSMVGELKKIFHASDDDSKMARMIVDALSECERKASPGETKRCVGSGEDMIDFAISVLGGNVVVRTTENTRGSNEIIMIGSVRGINGGKVTKSVSCHQSLFPYLLYYCHSVPKVRVYEADILDPKTKAKINHGVAICHIDTSSWSPGHGAFIALGSSPGKIEVCHWIFENDMTWAMAD